MKLLLDTHLLLWAAGVPDRLSAEARTLIGAPEHELFFSAASVWEIAIKRGLGRDDFQVDTRLLRRGLLDNGYGELPIGSEHVPSPSIVCLPSTETLLTASWWRSTQAQCGRCQAHRHCQQILQSSRAR